MNASAKLRWVYVLMAGFIVLFGVQAWMFVASSVSSDGGQCVIVTGIEAGLIFGFTLARVLWRLGSQAYWTKKWRNHFRSREHVKLTKRLAYKYRDLGVGIRVVRDDAFVAMALGIRRPTIIISDTVLNMFSEDEVEAIVLHEWHHCRNRDNAKLFIMRLATEGFSYMPIMRSLLRYYQTWMELLADRFAIRRMGTELPLASVLLKLAKLGNQRQHAAAIHFAAATLDYRIAQVLEPEQEITVKVPLVRPLFFTLSLLLLLMIGGDA
ncbi:M56 family metallopeptidase [Paenibacillus kobensis]|uniref:M56 family metallopeptidase n=1 Tax=Paenibacillus kobensis TaxID=59841 RepID=UPI000FD8FEAE|nr:M56 family metallopeptidase [Paenibacillus kobensis]